MKKVSIGAIDFEKGGGLVPVVARDNATGKVLMLAYADREAVARTVKTGFAHYFSRSRGRLWRKGEESGNVQRIKVVKIDCDRDSLLYEVDQTGPACHTGEESCFFSELREVRGNEYDAAMATAALQLLKSADIVRRRWVPNTSRTHYDYLVNPITEGIPAASPEVLEWIVGVLDRVAPKSVDKIVTFEALGVPYATLLAQRRKKPLVIIRKRDFHSQTHLFAKVPYASGFEKGNYFVYGVSRGDRVILVDDMVSTGGSLIPTIKAMRSKGAVIAAVLCVAEKPEYGGSPEVKRKTGQTVKTLFEISVKGNRVSARPTPMLSNLLGISVD